MGKFYVEVPVVVKMMVGIDNPDVTTEEEAIDHVIDSEVALELKDENGTFDFVDWEWEMHKKVVQGNFYFGGINEALAEREPDDDDDE